MGKSKIKTILYRQRRHGVISRFHVPPLTYGHSRKFISGGIPNHEHHLHQYSFVCLICIYDYSPYLQLTQRPVPAVSSSFGMRDLESQPRCNSSHCATRYQLATHWTWNPRDNQLEPEVRYQKAFTFRRLNHVQSPAGNFAFSRCSSTPKPSCPSRSASLGCDTRKLSSCAFLCRIIDHIIHMFSSRLWEYRVHDLMEGYVTQQPLSHFGR